MSEESYGAFVSNYNYETEIDKLKKRIRELELAARLKEVEHKAALTATRADGIREAREAVADCGVGGWFYPGDALVAIDELTAEPEPKTEGGKR